MKFELIRTEEVYALESLFLFRLLGSPLIRLIFNPITRNFVCVLRPIPKYFPLQVYPLYTSNYNMSIQSRQCVKKWRNVSITMRPFLLSGWDFPEFIEYAFTLIRLKTFCLELFHVSCWRLSEALLFEIHIPYQSEWGLACRISCSTIDDFGRVKMDMTKTRKKFNQRNGCCGLVEITNGKSQHSSKQWLEISSDVIFHVPVLIIS